MSMLKRFSISGHAQNHYETTTLKFYLYGNVWNQYVIQEIEILEGPMYCNIQCQLNTAKCDFAINNGNICYLALYTKQPGPLINDNNEQRLTIHREGNLFLKAFICFVSCISFLDTINQYIEPFFETWEDSTTHWSMFVYKTHEGVDGFFEGQKCALECMDDDNCDFYAIFDNKCWFGNMTHQGTYSNNDHSIIKLRKGKLTILTISRLFSNIFFSDQVNANFIFDLFDDWTGNTANLNSIISSDYFKFGIYAKIPDTSEDKCAIRCRLSHTQHCNFYVVINDHCQLGRFNFRDGGPHGLITKDTIIKVRKDYIASLDSIISAQLQPEPNPYLCSNKGYHNKADMIYTSSSDNHPLEYEPNVNCHYAFRNELGSKLTITVTKFNTTDDTEDKLLIYLGTGTSSFWLGDVFGEPTLPIKWENLESKVVTFHWTTNGNADVGTGFEATVEFF